MNNSFKVNVGDVWRINFGKGNPNNAVIHIRAIVDEDYAVWRVYNRHKKRWDYEIKHNYTLCLLDSDGFLEFVRHDVL